VWINRLRRQGIASATVDALIAATAIRREAVLFAIDDDFLPFIEYGGLRMLDN
jgi:predicted nucleic acid-binding protein